MSIEPKLGYFSIWGSSFRLLFRHFGLVAGAVLLLAAPFFVLDGFANAKIEIERITAVMQYRFIAPEEMVWLWSLLVVGDAFAFLGLGLAFLMVVGYLSGKQQNGFIRYVARELPRWAATWRFWVIAVLLVAVHAMLHIYVWIRSDLILIPIVLALMLIGIVVLAMFVLRNRQGVALKKRLRQATWLQRLALFFMLFLTVPAITWILIGYLYRFFLIPLVDMGGQQIIQSIQPGSPAFAFGVISVAKFIAMWLNFLPVALVTSTYLALCGAPSESRKK